MLFECLGGLCKHSVEVGNPESVELSNLGLVLDVEYRHLPDKSLEVDYLQSFQLYNNLPMGVH